MLLDTNRQRAGLLLLLLGLSLLVALAPFATGLLAIPVLYVIFRPVQAWLAQRLGARAAAAVVTGLALLLVVVPGVVFVGLLINQARAMAATLADHAVLDRLAALHIGRFELGPYVADVGSRAVTWLGGSALGLIGTATRQALNLLIALFGLYYLLLQPGEAWDAVTGYQPFSAAAAERLRARFHDVTVSTIIGVGVAGAIQGVLTGIALALAGVPNVLFWAMVTMALGVLPVVGSGMVWGPAATWLFLEGRPGAGAFLVLWGLLVVGNVDYFIRPFVFKRWANIHPLTTLVGAFAGVRYFGLLGLLIGPLALSYFFELVSLYRQEFPESAASTEMPH